MRFIPIKFYPTKNAPKDIVMPTRATKYSAGYDFYAPEDILVPAHGKSKLVSMYVKASMPLDMYLGITIRSSLATKHDIVVKQGEAIIDADYFNNASNEGEIFMMFKNDGDEDYTIEKGDKCCQGIFKHYATTVDDNCQTLRDGGLGSTGV